MPSHQALLLSILCFWATGCVSIVSGYGPSPEQWASKSILHILTDRFALEDCPANPRPCKDLDNACGGNHIGLRHRLDYIQVGTRGNEAVCRSCVRKADQAQPIHRTWALMPYGSAQ